MRLVNATKIPALPDSCYVARDDYNRGHEWAETKLKRGQV